ncbi:MAG: hypothetical protein J7M34_00530, partial [Anaerolineae bacterium]|nr:hypothetical protein [Anaerolineae bacterium]
IEVGSAVIVLVVWRLWQRGRVRSSLAHDLSGAVWALVGIWVVPVAVGYWAHGVSVSWCLPSVALAFWHLWGLAQLWALPLVAVPLILLVGLSATVMARWRVRAD